MILLKQSLKTKNPIQDNKSEKKCQKITTSWYFSSKNFKLNANTCSINYKNF